MNENLHTSISRRPHLTKEQRLPKCYKEVEKIVNSVKSCHSSFKTAATSARLGISQRSKVYKLCLNVLQYYNYIQKIIEKSQILVKEKYLRKEIASILIYELIFGKGSLPGQSKAVTTVQAYQNDIINIHQELQSHNTDCIEFNEIFIPRYARVHTLVTTVPYVIKDLEDYGFKQIFYDENTSEEMFLQLIKNLEKGNFLVDFHFKDILVFAQGEKLIELDLYQNGHIFLQDKASYIPVHVLNPEPGSIVLDACAAPGMKSAHIASKMKNKGVLIACERDESRFKTLKETMKYGSVKISKTLCTDFKSIDPNDEAYSAVEYILLDPSCSGSGIVQRMDEVTDTEESKTKDRLNKLAGFQIILLKHALKFPSVKRVVYSTCSVHEEENEYVVHEALNAFYGAFKLVPVIPEWFDRGSENYEFGGMCLRTVSKKHLTNGFFVAMFERIDTYVHRGKNFVKNKTEVGRSEGAPLEEVESLHSKYKTVITQKETSFGDKTLESIQVHDQNDDMTYKRNREKSKKLKSSQLTKHKEKEKKYVTDIQFKSNKQSQKQLVNASPSEVLQKSENSEVLKRFPKMYNMIGENPNISTEEKKTTHESLSSTEETFENFESNSGIFSNDKRKKRKKEHSAEKSNSSFMEIGNWNYGLPVGGNLKHKKKKKKEHSADDNIDTYVQVIEPVTEINSFESKPKKRKNYELSCSMPSNHVENKAPKTETVSSEATPFIVKKSKKHKKHSKNADIMASNIPVYDLSESQYHSENYTKVKPAENSHNTSQCKEKVIMEEYLTDSFSRHKKHKKHSKHVDKSEGSIETKNYSPEENVHYSSTVELVKEINKMVSPNPEEININISIENFYVNQNLCHVTKKKYKNDAMNDSTDLCSANNVESNHDPNKVLLKNEVESAVTLVEDHIRRKKHKKHKKYSDDFVSFIIGAKNEEGVKEENISTARTIPTDSFNSVSKSKNSRWARDCNTGVSQDCNNLLSQPNELENILLNNCEVKKKKKKHKKHSIYKETT